MTFEEACSQCAPFDNCWVWTAVARLDHGGWRYMLVVRTLDGRSTLFNFSKRTCEEQISRVPDRYDLAWSYTLTDRSGNDWHAGGLAEMQAWGRSLFSYDV